MRGPEEIETTMARARVVGWGVCVAAIPLLAIVLTATAGAQTAGKVDAAELYKLKCQVCHMADGNSQMMPNMSFADGVWKNGSSIKEVSATITNGVTGTAMVAFKEQLSAAEIASLARSVRKFDKKLK
jgi:mono/diheme cytochrome c family protein